MISVLSGGFKNFHKIRITNPVVCINLKQHWDIIALQATVAQATMEDVPNIKSLIRNYIIDDPLFFSCGIKTDQIENCLLNFLVDKVKEGHSVVAKSLDGYLTGVSINSVITRSEASKLRDISVSATDDPIKRVCSFWAHLELQPRIWEKFDVSHVFQIRVLVHPYYRHHGIAKLLTQTSRNKARQLDYPFLRMDCTNAYAARACHSLGFKCILCTPVHQYITKDKSSLFMDLPKQPHDVVKVYIDQIKCYS